jgi:hypothetical protein
MMTTLTMGYKDVLAQYAFLAPIVSGMVSLLNSMQYLSFTSKFHSLFTHCVTSMNRLLFSRSSLSYFSYLLAFRSYWRNGRYQWSNLP